MAQRAYKEEHFDEGELPQHGLVMTLEAFEDLVFQEGPYHYEMIGGRVYNMAPPSPEHDTIAYNMRRSFTEQLEKLASPCRVFQDQRVAIPGDYPSVEPDVLITCNSDDWNKKRRKKHHYFHFPVLVVEILSPSTMEFDRNEKFARYRLLPSLQVYMLVSQDKQYIEVYQRKNGWKAEKFKAEETIHLDQMGLELPLSEIYKRVFSEE